MYSDLGTASDLLNSELMCNKDIRAELELEEWVENCFIAILLSAVFLLAF